MAVLFILNSSSIYGLAVDVYMKMGFILAQMPVATQEECKNVLLSNMLNWQLYDLGPRLSSTTLPDI